MKKPKIKTKLTPEGLEPMESPDYRMDVDPDFIPVEIKEKDNWCNWSGKFDAKNRRYERFQCNTGSIFEERLNDFNQGVSFEKAFNFHQKQKDCDGFVKVMHEDEEILISRAIFGVCYMFEVGDPFTQILIDDCIAGYSDDGSLLLTDIARKVISYFSNSYIEIRFDNESILILVKAYTDLADPGVLGIELPDSNVRIKTSGSMAITGYCIADNEVEDNFSLDGQASLDRFLNDYYCDEGYQWHNGRYFREDTWLQPVDFDNLYNDDLPDISVDTLPDPLNRFAVELSEFTQTPVELSIALILSVISAAIGHKFEITVKEGYSEPLNEYFLVAMDSGERKTPVFNQILSPISHWERVKVKEAESENAKISTVLTLKNKQIKALENKYAKSESDTDQADILKKIKEINLCLPELMVPEKIFTDDSTTEAFIELLANNMGHLAIFSDEGGIFDIMAGRYSNGKANIDAFLKGHVGSQIKVARKGQTEIVIENPYVTIGMTVQPNVLKSVIQNDTFVGRGLAARFKYFVPSSRVGRRNVNATPVSRSVKDAYQCCISTLLDLGADKSAKKTIKLSSKALQCWHEFSAKIEARLQKGNDFEKIKPWANKMAGSAVRIAGLVHIVKNLGTDPTSKPIQSSTMKKAFDFMQVSAMHALVVFDKMKIDASIELAQKILDWLVEEKIRCFRKRDCQQKFKTDTRKTKEIEKAIQVLIDTYHILELEEENAKSYDVNPYLF